MNIYIGNLTPDTTEDEVREAFAPFGDVASVKIIRDGATGESRGFGFVEMPNEEQAKTAINEMNEKELKGNQLHVELGRSKPAAPGMAGGRRPGGHSGGPRGGGGGRPGGRPGGGFRGRGGGGGGGRDRGPRGGGGGGGGGRPRY
jgi:RNA recognition motif-containing protein